MQLVAVCSRNKFLDQMILWVINIIAYHKKAENFLIVNIHGDRLKYLELVIFTNKIFAAVVQYLNKSKYFCQAKHSRHSKSHNTDFLHNISYILGRGMQRRLVEDNKNCIQPFTQQTEGFFRPSNYRRLFRVLVGAKS